jgi:hypothetical protein
LLPVCLDEVDGKMSWRTREAYKTLKRLGINCTITGIETELYRGRRGEGSIPTLTESQETLLDKVVEGKRFGAKR